MRTARTCRKGRFEQQAMALTHPALLIELLANDLDHSLRCRARRKKAKIFSVTANEINEPRMVDCVRFAVLCFDLGVIDLVGESDLADIACRSSQADQARMEG